MQMHFVSARIMLPLGLALLATLAPARLAAQAEIEITFQEVNVDTYVELLRADIRAQHAAIVSAMMQFTPEEAETFWPIYTEYAKELAAHGDQKLVLIKHYTQKYASLSDDEASSLLTGALDIEAARTSLKRKYSDRISEALSAKIAARFMQIENQLLLILDLQIASNLPLMH